jgi:hypothetical protein
MNYLQARDFMLSVFKQAWDTTGLFAAYDDLPASKPSGQSAWARASITHATGGQGSLSNESGVRRWDRTGVLSVQVFAPVGDGIKTCYALATLVSSAFESSQGSDVWFRNVRLNEAGVDGAFYQINVLADFSYEDVR